jgi:hypothetical protein
MAFEHSNYRTSVDLLRKLMADALKSQATGLLPVGPDPCRQRGAPRPET